MPSRICMRRSLSWEDRRRWHTQLARYPHGLLFRAKHKHEGGHQPDERISVATRHELSLCDTLFLGQSLHLRAYTSLPS